MPRPSPGSTAGRPAGLARAADAVGHAAKRPPPSSRPSGIAYQGPVDGHDIARLERRSRRWPAVRGRWCSTSHTPRAAATRRPRPTRTSACTTSARSTRPPESPPRSRRRCQLHPRLRRGAGGRGRGPARGRGPHRGHGRAHRSAPFADRYPDRFFDVGHRRAARGHRGGGHGHGRAATSGGHLLDLPQPGLGPGLLRRGPAPAAGDLLPRSAGDRPATTGPATTACSTSPSSPRCRG